MFNHIAQTYQIPTRPELIKYAVKAFASKTKSINKIIKLFRQFKVSVADCELHEIKNRIAVNWMVYAINIDGTYVDSKLINCFVLNRSFPFYKENIELAELDLP